MTAPTIQRNLLTLAARLELVRAHCMCLEFKESPTHYVVYYPEGFFPDGVRASKGLGKIEALKKMLERMELDWTNNSPFTK